MCILALVYIHTYIHTLHDLVELGGKMGEVEMEMERGGRIRM